MHANILIEIKIWRVLISWNDQTRSLPKLDWRPLISKWRQFTHGKIIPVECQMNKYIGLRMYATSSLEYETPNYSKVPWTHVDG